MSFLIFLIQSWNRDQQYQRKTQTLCKSVDFFLGIQIFWWNPQFNLQMTLTLVYMRQIDPGFGFNDQKYIQTYRVHVNWLGG